MHPVICRRYSPLNLLKKVMPRPLRKFAKRTIVRIGQYSSRVFCHNSFIASVFYVLWNTQFYREHRAVLAGRAQYWRSLKQVDVKTSVRLRRNVHRLEKGLIMKARRKVFALGYISETVDAYQRFLESPVADFEEVRWADDVLDRYFKVVAPHPEIQRQRHRFELMREERAKVAGAPAVPFAYQELPDHGISHAQLRVLFQHRRSVRWFHRRAVPVEKIHEAIDSARLAPSSCNRQPYRFYVTTDSASVQELAGCAMGTSGYVHNIPSLIVLVGDLSAFFSERDRHLIYIDGALAAMQLLLALDTLGLATCSINWPDIGFREKRLAKLLELRPYERPVMLIAVGYADENGGIPYSQKKGSELLIKNVVL